MRSTAYITFLIALMASAGLTVPVRAFALHIGMVDHPGARKIHLKPMPLLGGLAIYFAFVLAVLYAARGTTDAQILSILAGATLMVLVGCLDDRGLLHHQVKLFLGMPCAAAILWFAGIRPVFFSSILPGTLGVLLDGMLTIVWVTGIIAAFSILDHMDGLCAGAAAVAAGFFAIGSAITGQFLVCSLSAAVLGAALGFLMWNFNPAKIFMGDGGAMLLGFLMATLSLKIRPPATLGLSGYLVPVLILVVPLLDTALVSVSRSRRGLLPFASPGKDHTAHRLSNLGLGTRGAVLLLYFLGMTGGILAILLLRSAARLSILPLALGLAVAIVAIVLLEKSPYDDPRRPSI
jgi:UDP-GlcNAc:undecaprenyl-phosphate GlcNAc-1-phosphate transferase